MNGTFRQSMAWLHTWGGLWLGWVLYAIFFTGAIGVFDEAITHWMNPERRALAAASGDTVKQQPAIIDRAQAYLVKVAPKSHFWSVGLPDDEEPALRVFWEDEKKNFQSARLDPATGQAIPPGLTRETEGGHHFVHMHFEFHAGMAGIWIAGVATIAMLVALVSGIVTHRRIFKDFFTFRPKKGQRSWLDAHNATGVLMLPFLLMISYTGVIVFYATYMPAGIAARYKGNEDAYFAEVQKQPSHREETGISAAVKPMGPLTAQAVEKLGRPASFVVVEHPGDSSASLRVFGRRDEAAQDGRLRPLSSGEMTFDAVTGEVLDVEMPLGSRGGPAQHVQQVMNALHFVQFGGYLAKWLYFFCGLAGAVMLATGMILFTVKRRRKQENEFGRATQRVYRVIEALNVASVAGLAVASIAFFWANRLVPLAVEHRSTWEIALFFAVWVATLLHAFVRPVHKAWIEQLAAGAAMCLLLPVLNAFTTGDHLALAIARGDALSAGVEATIFVSGLLMLATIAHLRRAARAPARSPKVPQPSVGHPAATGAAS